MAARAGDYLLSVTVPVAECVARGWGGARGPALEVCLVGGGDSSGSGAWTAVVWPEPAVVLGGDKTGARQWVHGRLRAPAWHARLRVRLGPAETAGNADPAATARALRLTCANISTACVQGRGGWGSG